MVWVKVFQTDSAHPNIFAFVFLSFSGGYTGGATPVPIPNTEVKSSRADGTAGATLWESRTLSGFFGATPNLGVALFFDRSIRIKFHLLTVMRAV